MTLHFGIEVELPDDLSDNHHGQILHELRSRIEKLAEDSEYWIKETCFHDKHERRVKVKVIK